MALPTFDHDKLIIFRNLVAFLDFIFVILLLMRVGNGAPLGEVTRSAIPVGVFSVLVVVSFFMVKYRWCSAEAAEESRSGSGEGNSSASGHWRIDSGTRPPPSSSLPPLGDAAHAAGFEASAPSWANTTDPFASARRPRGSGAGSGAGGKDQWQSLSAASA